MRCDSCDKDARFIQKPDYYGPWEYSCGCGDEPDYYVPISDMVANAKHEIPDWIRHLSQKPWCSTRDLGQFIAYVRKLQEEGTVPIPCY